MMTLLQNTKAHSDMSTHGPEIYFKSKNTQ